MKRFLMALVALSFIMAASLTGCTNTSRGGAEFCTCDKNEGIREIAPPPPPSTGKQANAGLDTDLVVFGGIPETTEPAEDKHDATPSPDKYALREEYDGEDHFSEEAMTQKIRELEASGKNESAIVQEIIFEGYDEVPTVTSTEPAVNIKTAPNSEPEVAETEKEPEAYTVAATEPASEETDAPAETEEALRDMAADFQKYLDIEAYTAEEPVAAATAPVSAPVAEVEEPVAAEESAALLPPPLRSAPEPETGAAEFTTAAEPRDLSLDGFDDMDLEYFGSISESLLDTEKEG